MVRATEFGLDLENVALLLGAQTAGSLSSNVLWGWWGDQRGKGSLLQAVAFGRAVPPVLMLAAATAAHWPTPVLMGGFLVVFFLLGALANGLTIAVIGFLMEISPDDKRPSYSGYFNALTAPAYLLPLLAGVVASWMGLAVVFLIAALAAIAQAICVSRIRDPAQP